jgi:hypothetical protein
VSDANGHGGAPGIATETRSTGTGERSAGSTTMTEIGATGLGVGVGARIGAGEVGPVVSVGLALAELGAPSGVAGAGRGAATATTEGCTPGAVAAADVEPADCAEAAAGPGELLAATGRGWFPAAGTSSW